jgi:hypothetical protein
VSKQLGISRVVLSSMELVNILANILHSINNSILCVVYNTLIHIINYISDLNLGMLHPVACVRSM